MLSKTKASLKRTNNMNVEELKEIFMEGNKTLGSVESFTGGLFASTITKVPGASNFYKGGLVTYWTEEKERLLGILHEYVEKYGVVSKEIAERMAMHGLDILNVDACVSFTGNAGPTAMEGKPVGEIYIGIATQKDVKVYSYHFKGSREEIQKQAVQIAIDLLCEN